MPVSLAVALGGALGVSARYGLDRVIERRSSALFPWSTFTINVTGCLLIGVIVGALVDRHHTPAWLRVGLVMGVLGGYTTFSTFAQETLGLLDARDFAVAVAYAGGSVALGVTAAWIGTHVGHAL
jgi:fluoride exporter